MAGIWSEDENARLIALKQDAMEAVLYLELTGVRSLIARFVGSFDTFYWPSSLPYRDRIGQAMHDHALVTLALGGDHAAELAGVEHGGSVFWPWSVGSTPLPEEVHAWLSTGSGLGSVPESSIRAAGDYALKLADVTSRRVLDGIHQVILDGTSRGQTWAEIARALRTGDTLPSDAPLGWSNDRVTRLVRTETAREFGNGHLLECWSLEDIVAWRYSNLCDMRTSDLCRWLNGQIVTRDAIGTTGMGWPPFHPHCRTWMRPIFAWEMLGSERAVDWNALPDGRKPATVWNPTTGERETMGRVDVPLW